MSSDEQASSRAAGVDEGVGLLGGSIERRLEHSKVPPLDLPHVLAPFRRPSDQAVLRDFLRHPEVFVEIGFARAHHLLDLAAGHPEAHVLGFEVKRRWCRDADRKATRRGLDNVRVIEGDARPYFGEFIEDGSLRRLFVLFPDPWWKKRHHKRRIFQPEFTAVIHRVLAPGGELITKTDVPAYADLIDEEVGPHTGFSLAGTSYDDPVLGALPRSHREKKCHEMAIPVFQFRFVKEVQ